MLIFYLGESIMVFNLKNAKTKVLALVGFCAGSLLMVTSVYAVDNQSGISNVTPLTTQQVAVIIKKSDFNKSFQISATPEVVSEINNIRDSNQAQTYISASLQRMKKYQPLIQEALIKNKLPTELLAIPLVESGYRPLPANVNPVQAAGIWQFIPHTAQKFGLVINDNRDDRLNTQLSTEAAISYLSKIHSQFDSWGLTVLSYEYGEDNVANYVKTVGSRDAWTIVRSTEVPSSMKGFFTKFNAFLIIMKNPSILNQ
jgi:membrane-bound lytic murein transglycosylase D